MSGEEITRGELMSLFEAARWAPSSNNNQPWRFVYCVRNSPEWETFFNLLTEGNKVWCKNAAALIVAVSKTTFDSGKPARTHSFDTGAAWMSLALQGALMGLVVHGMQGFDYDRAKTELGVPDEYAVEAMIAVGRQGRVEDLPEDKRAVEFPKGRKSVAEFVFEGRFGG
jgi:nitroreductase